MRGLLKKGILLAMGTAVCTGAQAAGFALSDKSVSGLGSGMAGEAAYAEDASTVYGNPAGMLALSGRQVTVGFNRLTTTAKFSDAGSTNVNGSNCCGSNTAETVANIPTFYYVQELQPDLRLGFGVNTPFGLGLHYDNDWMGRYHTVDTDIKTINLTPGIAYRVSPKLAIGGTIDVEYMEAALKTAVDFGSICVAKLTPIYGQAGALTACNANGLQPRQDDGYNKLKGDSWGTGFSLGLTYALSDATQLGAVYHSGVSQSLKGTSKWENTPSVLFFPTTFTDSDATVKVDLPPSASLGITHAMNEKLRLMAQYTWTGWSSYKELRVDYSNNLPDSVSEEKWNDVSRYSLGLLYQADPAWLLRAGFFYDQTPVPDVAHRTPRLPDTDRRWVTLGAKWAAAEAFSVDMALAYVNEQDIPINRTDAYGHTIKGTYEVTGTYLSVQGNWSF